MDPSPQEQIGAYRVRRRLGEGGMGTVFLAETAKGTPVVLKMPSRPTADLRARMGDEAHIGFRLRHPHIVRTLDFFEDDDRPVLVIEFIDGASMKELRESVGKIPPAMIARIGEQISDALATIHHLKDVESGEPLQILHRDVTPGNILIARDGDAKLIDLGIARSVESQAQKTSAGVLRGTFRYLSPDLFAGMPYSWMTDLWALGVSLFEGALGRRAMIGTDPVSAMRDLIAGKLTCLLPGEELNPMLRFLFDGLLAVDQGDRRFRDPEEVLHAFRVIRGRLGDGADEARALMAGVAAVDELAPNDKSMTGTATDLEEQTTQTPNDVAGHLHVYGTGAHETAPPATTTTPPVQRPGERFILNAPAPPPTDSGELPPTVKRAPPGSQPGFASGMWTVTPTAVAPVDEFDFEEPTLAAPRMVSGIAPPPPPPAPAPPPRLATMPGPPKTAPPAPVFLPPPATVVEPGFAASPATSIEEPEDRRSTVTLPMKPIKDQ
ncbi:MAG: serine/threonine-protein kinase [Deltaproteobacteria bacterium]|nr:serine/threonine-protein kinase [Deltaproteobacteria bacterium]